MQKIYKILILVLIILGVFYLYYRKTDEHYADQVMHWYAGGIAGPVITPDSVYGIEGEKVKFMERESY